MGSGDETSMSTVIIALRASTSLTRPGAAYLDALLDFVVWSLDDNAPAHAQYHTLLCTFGKGVVKQNECQEDCGCIKKSYSWGDFKQGT